MQDPRLQQIYILLRNRTSLPRFRIETIIELTEIESGLHQRYLTATQESLHMHACPHLLFHFHRVNLEQHVLVHVQAGLQLAHIFHG